MKIEDVYGTLVNGTCEFFHKSGFAKAIIGLSGGIDSALTAAICFDALRHNNILGVAMPSRYSSIGSVMDAQKLAINLGIKFIMVPIDDIVRSIVGSVQEVPSDNMTCNFTDGETFDKFASDPQNATIQNIQARARMIILMGLSNQYGALVVNTCNLTEDLVGYSTLYGDSSGAIAPLGQVGKLMVYELAKWRNEECLAEPHSPIPDETITKAPSAELCPRQTDEGSLGIQYEVLDPLSAELNGRMNNGWYSGVADLIEKYGEEAVDEVTRLITMSAYKRLQAPPSIPINYDKEDQTQIY